MRAISKFDIKRLKKNCYVVVIGDQMIADFTTFTEAQDFIFIQQTNELAGMAPLRQAA